MTRLGRKRIGPSGGAGASKGGNRIQSQLHDTPTRVICKLVDDPQALGAESPRPGVIRLDVPRSRPWMSLEEWSIALDVVPGLATAIAARRAVIERRLGIGGAA
jgi:hypothetical protein